MTNLKKILSVSAISLAIIATLSSCKKPADQVEGTPSTAVEVSTEAVDTMSEETAGLEATSEETSAASEDETASTTSEEVSSEAATSK